MGCYSISNFTAAILVTFFVLFHPCKSAVMKVPEDVTRLENLLKDFEGGQVLMVPTVKLFKGEFPFALESVQHNGMEEHKNKREKRDVEPTEPGLTSTMTEDDLIRQYVRNEITRIFSCYQRLRCGYTRAQAEEECEWLEHSSLYHQLMKMLGIKNYPKKGLTTPAPINPHHVQPPTGYRSSRSHTDASDAAMNPLHQNLQNGIRYGGARPGHYLPSGGYTNRNRRAYDSFFTGQEVVASALPITS